MGCCHVAKRAARSNRTLPALAGGSSRPRSARRRQIVETWPMLATVSRPVLRYGISDCDGVGLDSFGFERLCREQHQRIVGGNREVPGAILAQARDRSRGRVARRQAREPNTPGRSRSGRDRYSPAPISTQNARHGRVCKHALWAGAGLRRSVHARHNIRRTDKKMIDYYTIIRY